MMKKVINMKKLSIFILTSVMLSSCQMYSKFSRPEITAVDSLYRYTEPNKSDTASLAALSWRELFADKQLQGLIEQGLSTNTNLQIAHLRITQAEAQLQSARLAYLPSVSLNPQSSLGSFDGSRANPTYSIAASASWEVDIFGKLTNAKERTKAALEQSHAYTQAVQTQLIATIANSYYTLLMLDRQIEISTQTALNWGENLRIMQALKRAGQATEVAVSQAQANKLSVEASLLTLKKQVGETENALSALLGMPSQTINRGGLLLQKFPSELSIGVPLQLLNRRPDVRQAEYALAQNFYSTNEARAAFYPTLTLGGSAGWTNSAGAAIVNPGNLLLSALGSLVQPIFNKGLNTARLKVAKAQQEETLLTFRQKLLDAGSEVNNALEQWQTAISRQTIISQQVAALGKAVNDSQMLMKHSSTNYLEVLTAQQSLLQAELTLATDKFNEIQGVINLYHALGGGVQ